MPKPAASSAAPAPTGNAGNAGNADNRPFHEVRHRRIRATVWRNETRNGPMYSVTVSRSYRDEGGVWKDSHSFGFDDLMNLAKALYDAHSFISAQLARDRAGDRPASPPPQRREARQGS